MSINFSTLQGLTIPEGVVTQIADASGRVLWVLQNGEPIVLEVEKITSDTYVSSKSYRDEEFLALDIYPKAAGSTVNVTYGGLTKTLTFSDASKQMVHFGTYGGVSDGTPASGTLTIEGGYAAVGVGAYNVTKSVTDYCGCITNVTSLGQVTSLPDHAFDNCNTYLNFKTLTIPESVTRIGVRACKSLVYVAQITIPPKVSYIGDLAFSRSVGKYMDVILKPTTPPVLGSEVFGYTVKNIIVPNGCGDVYKTAVGWSDYADIIVEES